MAGLRNRPARGTLATDSFISPRRLTASSYRL